MTKRSVTHGTLVIEREGGIETSRGGPGSGPIMTYEARFEDIVPGERIVTTYVMHQDERRISVSLATVELEPGGSGTRLRFTESGAYLDGFDVPGEPEHGTGELLDALGRYLIAEVAASAPTATLKVG